MPLPALSYAQSALIEKMLLYLDAKSEKLKKLKEKIKILKKENKKKQKQGIAQDEKLQQFITRAEKLLKGTTQENELPFTSAEGMCSGLGAYWGYLKRIGKEDVYLDKIENLLRWDPDSFLNTDDDLEKLIRLDDPKLEELISNVVFLQYEAFPIRPRGVTQDAIDKSINTILDQDLPKIAEAEFKLTFVFDKPRLTQILSDVAKPNKIIRVENGFHAIYIMREGDHFALCDQLESTKPIVINSLEELVDKNFSILSHFCGSTDFIALNIAVYDLEGEPVPTYVNTTEYMTHLLEDPAYKREVMQHKNIFNLAMRANNYALGDFLFANGYEYIPWNYDAETEINTAIFEKNKRKIKYLIPRVSIDAKSEVRGITPLGVTIIEHIPEIMYKLLAAGADPNVEPIEDWSQIDFAIFRENPIAIIMLLAFGLDVTRKDLKKLHNNFNRTKFAELTEEALGLNAQILGLPKHFILDDADINQTIAFLRHAKLMNQLERPLGDIQLLHNGVVLKGHNAVRAIAQAFPLIENWHDFNALEELYELIRFFKLDDVQNELEQELLATLDLLVKNICKDISEHSKDDLQDINLVVDNLQELSQQLASRPELLKPLQHALNEITDYLSQNHINITPEPHKHTTLFFSNRHPQRVLPIPAYAQAQQFLKLIV